MRKRVSADLFKERSYPSAFPEGALTQPVVKSMLPPGAACAKKPATRQWVTIFKGKKTFSKSWTASEGSEREAALFVLRAVWAKWHDNKHFPREKCPIPGLFYVKKKRKREVPEVPNPDIFPEGALTQPVVKAMLPPGASCKKTTAGKQWSILLHSRTFSKTWGIEGGEREAALFVLRAVWAKWLDINQLPEHHCPVTGLFSQGCPASGHQQEL